METLKSGPNRFLSLLRILPSLFALSMTKHLERVALPSPMPFDGVAFYNRTSMRYHSSFNVLKLIRAAKKELASSAFEQFRVFLLTVMAGLRRREIDTLEWSAFRWDRRMIRIEPTKWFHPKSEDSIGDVEIDPELIEVFRKYHANAKSPFVIASKVKPRLDVTFAAVLKASKSLQVRRTRAALKRGKDTAHPLTYRVNRENAPSFLVFHFASIHLVLNFSSGSDYHCDSRHGSYRAPRTICDRGGDGCRGIHK